MSHHRMTKKHVLCAEEGFYDEPGRDVLSSADCRALVNREILDAIKEAWKGREPR